MFALSQQLVSSVSLFVGRSRIEIPKYATYGELCKKISEHLHHQPIGVQLYKDDKFKKTLETMNLIDKAVSELEKRDEEEDLNNEEV